MTDIVQFSFDGKDNLTVPIAAASTSVVLKGFINNHDDPDTVQTVPIMNVTRSVFEELMTWATFHTIDAPTMSKEDIEAFEKQYLDIHYEPLFERIIAADFLNMEHLLDNLCHEAARRIGNKTPEEIFAYFGVEDTSTEEERQQILKEYPWINSE